ncbi:mCG17019, isoform CRA_b [Mus musculus]|nr:mCG17019, isoform CRA_b [Mus musculus]
MAGTSLGTRFYRQIKRHPGLGQKEQPRALEPPESQ